MLSYKPLHNKAMNTTSRPARSRKTSATATESASADCLRQILDAVSPGERLPIHLIAKRVGLQAHVTRSCVTVLVDTGKFERVRVMIPGGASRWFYARVDAPVMQRAITGADASLLAALAANKLYQMYQLARLANVGTSEIRSRVTALVESGHLVVVNKAEGNRIRARYRLAKTALSEAPDRTTPNPADDIPQATAHHILEAMTPGVAYRATTLGTSLGLSARRTTELLAVLLRDARVVRTMSTDRVPHPLFYVAGSAPGADIHRTTTVPSLWSNRPTFDSEYGRSLRSLWVIAEATRPSLIEAVETTPTLK